VHVNRENFESVLEKQECRRYTSQVLHYARVQVWNFFLLSGDSCKECRSLDRSMLLGAIGILCKHIMLLLLISCPHSILHAQTPNQQYYIPHSDRLLKHSTLGTASSTREPLNNYLFYYPSASWVHLSPHSRLRSG
jgi:hypothetical protein